MQIDDVEWNLDRLQHIQRRSVVPEEVEEVFASAPVFRRGRRGVYEAWGQTESGRFLLVIFRYLGHIFVGLLQYAFKSSQENRSGQHT